MCHQHCGTVTDAGLDDVGETIDIFSRLWRESNLSVTVKAHIIEVHLLDSIHRFRGLGKRDEEFMERDHQNGCLNDWRSSNIKDYSEKVKLHANWEGCQAGI